MTTDTYFINYNYRQASYISHVMNLLGQQGVTKVYQSQAVLNVDSLAHRCIEFGITKVIIFHPRSKTNVFADYLRGDKVMADKNWAGSVFDIEGTPVMIGLDISMWHSFGYYPLVMEKHIEKFTALDGNTIKATLLAADRYIEITEYNYNYCLDDLRKAAIIAIDIETETLNSLESDLMCMVGYSGLMPDNTVHTYVVDWTDPDKVSEETYQFMKEVNALPCPKVFHNGTYDIQFFMRYRMPVTGYMLDTEYMFKAIYAELPAALSFVSGFYLPTAQFWKNTAGINLARYNALDCYNTLCTSIYLLNELLSKPEFHENYRIMMQLVSVSTWMHLHGFNIDYAKVLEARKKAVAEVDKIKEELNIMVGGGVDFNPGSPKQIGTLLYDVLGAKKIRVKGKIGRTDELTLTKLSEQHDLIRIFADRITKYRKLVKSIGTYFDAKLMNNRLMFSYRVDGTETGRLSCKQSNFRYYHKAKTHKHYGAQAQNLPQYYRVAIIPDEGYAIGSLDNSQSEARCVAYLSNDTKLISALEDMEDFYNYCAHLFFDTPEDEVPLFIRNKVVKKIIHGSNYKMQGQTFVDVCGTAILLQAKKDLNENERSILSFANWLMAKYFDAYPEVKAWHDDIAYKLITERKLTSVLGWTRTFYSDPHSETTVRAAIAHGPQNLSVHIINNALIKLFWLVQIPSKGEFKILAQVHDEIVFQCVLGKEDYYINLARNIMEQDIKMLETGKIMRIPVDGKTATCWADAH